MPLRKAGLPGFRPVFFAAAAQTVSARVPVLFVSVSVARAVSARVPALPVPVSVARAVSARVPVPLVCRGLVPTFIRSLRASLRFVAGPGSRECGPRFA